MKGRDEKIELMIRSATKFLARINDEDKENVDPTRKHHRANSKKVKGWNPSCGQKSRSMRESNAGTILKELKTRI